MTLLHYQLHCSDQEPLGIDRQSDRIIYYSNGDEEEEELIISRKG